MRGGLLLLVHRTLTDEEQKNFDFDERAKLQHSDHYLHFFPRSSDFFLVFPRNLQNSYICK